MRSALPRTVTRRTPSAVLEVEGAFELVLEQAFDHWRFLFDLEVEGPLPQAGGRCGAQEVVALERAIGLRQVFERRLGNHFEQLERRIERLGRDRAPP